MHEMLGTILLTGAAMLIINETAPCSCLISIHRTALGICLFPPSRFPSFAQDWILDERTTLALDVMRWVSHRVS